MNTYEKYIKNSKTSKINHQTCDEIKEFFESAFLSVVTSLMNMRDSIITTQKKYFYLSSDIWENINNVCK